jgi:hypothetical protein
MSNDKLFMALIVGMVCGTLVVTTTLVMAYKAKDESAKEGFMTIAFFLGVILICALGAGFSSL